MAFSPSISPSLFFHLDIQDFFFLWRMGCQNPEEQRERRWRAGTPNQSSPGGNPKRRGTWKTEISFGLQESFFWGEAAASFRRKNKTPWKTKDYRHTYGKKWPFCQKSKESLSNYVDFQWQTCCFREVEKTHETLPNTEQSSWRWQSF